jgi:hypothetical protein
LLSSAGFKIEQSHCSSAALAPRQDLAFHPTGKGGMARIKDLGGVVVDLMVPDRHGKPTNVVRGYDDFASYKKGGVYNQCNFLRDVSATVLSGTNDAECSAT